MFKFSEYGIKNKDLFCRIYSDFIDWCKTKATSGTFSTYMDGEPYFTCCGLEVSYRTYLANR